MKWYILVATGAVIIPALYFSGVIGPEGKFCHIHREYSEDLPQVPAIPAGNPYGTPLTETCEFRIAKDDDNTLLFKNIIICIP